MSELDNILGETVYARFKVKQYGYDDRCEIYLVKYRYETEQEKAIRIAAKQKVLEKKKKRQEILEAKERAELKRLIKKYENEMIT